MKKALSNFLYHCWQVLAALIILLAVLISIARVLIPYSNDYKPDIEAWLSEQTGQNVSIGEIQAEWKMLGPAFTLHNVNIENIAYVGSLKVDIKTIPSLIYGNLITDNLSISGINLLINQNESGGFGLSTPETRAASSDSDLSITDIQDWLQRQTAITLLETQIQITLRNGESYPIKISEMQYASGRNISQLAGFSQLPGDNRIDFILEMNGFLTDPETTGQLFIDTHVLDLTQIPLAAFWQEARIQDGTLEVQLWLDWQNSGFDNGLIAIDVNKFQLNLQDIPQGQVNKLQTQVIWKDLEDGWQFQTHEALVESHGREWPEPFVQLRHIAHEDNLNKQYYLRSSLVDIGILTDLILAKQDLDNDLRKRLLAMDTQGFLDALQIDATLNADEIKDINLSARFSELDFNPYDTAPGVENLGGQIQLSEESGNLYLDSRYAKLNYPTMFRWELPLEYINADLDWKIANEEIDIILQHLDIKVMGTNLKADGIFNTENDDLNMNLYAELDDADMSKTRYFLPTGIMDPSLVAYLDNAVLSGELNNVVALLNGKGSDFPFTNGKGVFAIYGEVSRSDFAFQPDWPVLNDMYADLWFVGNGMDIQLTGANSYEQKVESASAIITDFSASPTILDIKATSTGTLEHAPDYLLNSPMQEDFVELFDAVKAAGPFSFNLDLMIPLDEGETIVNGALNFKDNPVNIPAANLPGKIIDGRIDIINGFAVSDNLLVDIMGGESKITLDQKETSKGIETSLTLNGELTTDGLYGSFEEELPSGLNGTTQYQGAISLPPNSDINFLLDIQTRMQGITADLPYPLYKSADVGWPMEFRFQIDSDDNQELDFKWLDKLHLKLGSNPEQAAFSGMIMLGQGTAELTEREGIEITGIVDQVDLVNWLDYFTKDEDSESDETIDISDFYLNELSIKDLDYYFLNFKENKVSATFTENDLDFLVDGNQIAGHIVIPLPVGSKAIDIDLEKLVIGDQFADAQSDSDEINLSEANAEPLPAIKLTCDECIYNEKRLAPSRVDLEPLLSGNKIKVQISQNDLLALDVSGEWQFVDDRVTTQISGDASTKDLSKLLRVLNQDPGIRDTPMDISGEIAWLGDPSMFNMKTLSGEVSLKGGRGSQNQLSDRPARIFSVLSLGNVARRLTLDFTDLFQDGFFYNGMSGSFKIDEGIFNTTDFDIRGTSADVSINGKTDFANNSIEHCILVKPDLGGSLPILAGWAIEPVTGFVVFLMSKIFKPAIDVVSSIRYQVEGTFDDPIVKEIGKSRAKATIEEEDSENPNIILEASEKPFSCDEQFDQ